MPSPFPFIEVVNDSIRPLDKGMVLNLPSDQLPKGAVIDASNYIAGLKGLTRRPALSLFTGGATVQYPPVRDIITAWTLGGVTITLVLDQKFVYKSQVGSLTPQYWTYSTGTVDTASGSTTITGHSTSWNTAPYSSPYVAVGDVLITYSSGSYPTGTVADTMIISSLSTASEVISETAAANAETGVNYVILHAFNPPLNNQVDYVVLPTDQLIVFADGRHAPMQYDVATGAFSSFDVTNDLGAAVSTFIPSCVGYFRDRVWFGNMQESATGYNMRYRLRWSKALGHKFFFDSVEGDVQWLDIPYTKQGMKRFVGLGIIAVAYMGDGVFIGRPTAIAGDDLPYSFELLQTRNNGLKGMKAVVVGMDAHFFVGEDDIWVLDSGFGLNKVGTPVLSETIQNCQHPENIYAINDVQNERVVFGFPEDGTDIAKVWSYNIRNGAWSYDAVSCNSLSLAQVISAYTWTTLPPATWTSMSVFGSWSNINGGNSPQKTYVGISDQVYFYDQSGTSDNGAPISASFTTPDIDMNQPDMMKTYLRFGVRIDRAVIADLNFTVQGSLREGTTFVNLGTLKIPQGAKEGYCDFLFGVSSVARFKLTSNDVVGQYTIIEATFKAYPEGIEGNMEVLYS